MWWHQKIFIYYSHGLLQYFYHQTCDYECHIACFLFFCFIVIFLLFIFNFRWQIFSIFTSFIIFRVFFVENSHVHFKSEFININSSRNRLIACQKTFSTLSTCYDHSEMWAFLWTMSTWIGKLRTLSHVYLTVGNYYIYDPNYYSK